MAEENINMFKPLTYITIIFHFNKQSFPNILFIISNKSINFVAGNLKYSNQWEQ